MPHSLALQTPRVPLIMKSVLVASCHKALGHGVPTTLATHISHEAMSDSHLHIAACMCMCIMYSCSTSLQWHHHAWCLMHDGA